MTNDVVSSPPSNSNPALLVDWLELSAFFSPFHIAKVDNIESGLKIQGEEQNTDIADEDAAKEQTRENIETEINFREQALQRAYPFELSSDGEALTLKSRGNRGGLSFYIFCLIVSHMYGSPILEQPPTDEDINNIRRKLFQVISTLAVAGHLNGPAISLGWPRESEETILEVVNRCCKASETGIARNKPASTASKLAKDGGIDVLAWEPSRDRPPPSRFMFGQVASGANWKDKSAKHDSEKFLRDYYDERPNCEASHVTICPFRVDETDLHQQSLDHGYVLDRTRLPLAAIKGVELAVGGTLVDEFNNRNKIAKWLCEYKRTVVT